MSDSEIKNFFEDQTIFITGGTGFLGKVLIEKLLRTCNVRKIYLLVRPKKDKTTAQRINSFFSYACFDRLKKEKPDFEDFVTFINGDCEVPNLGISSESREVLTRETGMVIHAAANVKFDQPLRVATNINIRSTRDILELAKKMPGLKAFVYVSTAYSNCPHRRISEEFYKPPMTPTQLMNIIDNMSDKEQLLSEITSKMINPWPNTYTFTKSIAEDLIKTEGEDLPIVIVRPAIITSTLEEPMPGWTDNFYGVAGIVGGAALGALRSFNGKLDNTVAIVPCDYTANVVLATAWNATQERPNDTTIYNYAGSNKNVITWKHFVDYIEDCAWDYPTDKIVWYYTFKIRENPLWHKICVFFQHTLVAYIVDLLLVCVGKKPIAVKNYNRIDALLNLTSYFSMNYWTFDSGNLETLWARMGDRDKELFPFNMDSTDWKSFARSSVEGGRIYLLKDPMETIPRGKRKLWFLRVAHYSLLTAFYILLFLLLKKIVALLF